MRATVVGNVAKAVVDDVYEGLPEEIYEYYENVPGRAPSDRAKRVSVTMRNLERDAALELIEEVVDQTIFSVLYLLEARFKDLNVETRFLDLESGEENLAVGVLDEYRRYQAASRSGNDGPS